MLIRRALALFLPAAVVATALTGAVYVTAQQAYRQSANDPQLQLAQDAAAALDAGAPAGSVVGTTPIDYGASLAPFVTVFDAKGVLLATGGRLGGHDPAPPKGMLEAAVAGSPNVVTWQPRSDVRIAAVAVPWSGGTVLAGRSLREVERRVDQLLLLVAAVWIATLVGLVVASFVAAWIWPRAQRAVDPAPGSVGPGGSSSAEPGGPSATPPSVQ
jgi:hypothetical protein